MDLEYKRLAVAELARYLSAFPNVDLIDAVKEIVEEGLAVLNEDDDDLQMKPMYVIYESSSNCSRLVLRANLYSVAAAGFQPLVDPNRVANAVWILNLFTTEIPIATVWSTRIAVCKAAQTFIHKCIGISDLTLPEESLLPFWESLKIVASDRGYESVRTAAARTVGKLVEWVKGHPEWTRTQQKIRGELPGVIEAETSTVVQAEYRSS